VSTCFDADVGLPSISTSALTRVGSKSHHNPQARKRRGHASGVCALFCIFQFNFTSLMGAVHRSGSAARPGNRQDSKCDTDP
jgi:hypothetical protein